MLLAGCATLHRPAAATETSAVDPATVATIVETDPDDADAKQVEAHAHYAQALIYELDEKPDKALEEYTQSALNDPANEDLVLEVSRRYLQRREPERSVDLLTAAADLPGASGEIFARLGLVYSRLGEDEKAVTTTQKAIEREPRSLAGYQNLFIIHMQKARLPKALEVLDAAAKATNTNPEFLIGLGGLYANFERQAPSQQAAVNPRALEVLDRAARQDPAVPHLRLKMADDYNELGDTTNAAKIYVDLLERYPAVTSLRDDVRPKLAEIYWRKHDAAKATEQLEAIVREDPSNSKAYYWLGSIASEEKKLPEAVDYFQKALLMNEDFTPAYYDLAEVLINLDRARDALATLEKARAKFAPSFTTEFLEALAYSRNKDYTNALGRFTAAEVIARTSEPDRLNSYFYYEEGSTYERKGDYEQAEKCFDKSLALQPDFAEALNYLGFMLADRGVKLEHAHALIEKAVKLEPRNAAYVDSLGWVLYKLDRPQEALAQIQRAITLSGEVDATIYDHLGDIYARLKQPEKARDAWKKSLTVEPSQEIRKKLDNAAGKAN
jgi:tetratricopeptide (TPR) repeat protein